MLNRGGVIGAVVGAIIGLGLLSIPSHGGKVNWDSKGKPQIEKSEKPVKGCNLGGIGSLGGDNNESKTCGK